MNKIKIIVIGPTESGKTVLSNIIADATESSNKVYDPTQGVRILEFEGEPKIDIELWDTSGDNKFGECWPAIAKDNHGVIFVYNPDQDDQGDELERLFQYFVQQHSLKPSQCVIVANNKSGGSTSSLSRPPTIMANLPMMMISNLDDDSEVVKNGFRAYLKRLLQVINDKQRQEEDSLVFG
ncbi:Intraflagellar transport protein 22 [Chamberlinius hualienensis]